MSPPIITPIVRGPVCAISCDECDSCDSCNTCQPSAQYCDQCQDNCQDCQMSGQYCDQCQDNCQDCQMGCEHSCEDSCQDTCQDCQMDCEHSCETDCNDCDSCVDGQCDHYEYCDDCQVCQSCDDCNTDAEICGEDCGTTGCDTCQDACASCDVSCNKSCQKSCQNCDHCQSECQQSRQTPYTSQNTAINNAFSTVVTPAQFGKIELNYWSKIFDTVETIKAYYNSFTYGTKPFAIWSRPNFTINTSIIPATMLNDIISNSATANTDKITVTKYTKLKDDIGNYQIDTAICNNCNTSCNDNKFNSAT